MDTSVRFPPLNPKNQNSGGPRLQALIRSLLFEIVRLESRKVLDIVSGDDLMVLRAPVVEHLDSLFDAAEYAVSIQAVFGE
jgi:hypothetical protein